MRAKETRINQRLSNNQTRLEACEERERQARTHSRAAPAHHDGVELQLSHQLLAVLAGVHAGDHGLPTTGDE
jgi:hypothetical protein